MLGRLIAPEIQEYLESGRLADLKAILSAFPAIDVADLIDDLGDEERGVVFRLLSHDLAIDVFEELSLDSQSTLIQSLASAHLAGLLEEMAPDERTALLEDLPSKITRRLLNLLSPKERQLATKLLGYPEDSAGRLMTPDLVWIKESATASQALEKIRNLSADAETINICYVVNSEQKLLGVVALADLVLSQPDTAVSDIMQESLATVTAATDREEAAALCSKYDILAVPVTDDQERLLGIVTVDDLVDVIEEEATEDIHVMAGVVPPELPYLEVPLRELWWRRAVWLFALVLAQVIAGFVLHSNIEMLFVDKLSILAVFITVMTATGGSCGTQSATMVIRAMATGDLGLADYGRVLFREILIGVLLGLGVGVFVFLVACVVQWSDLTWSISLAIGLSLGILLALSNIIGAGLPLLSNKLGLDPALMAGPLITTLVDILGLLLYFQIAKMILRGLIAPGM